MARLREREGLTYAPETFVDQAVSQPHYAAVGVQIELPPAKTDAFFAELNAIVADLARTPIGADELSRARTPTVDNSKRASPSPIIGRTRSPRWTAIPLISR